MNIHAQDFNESKIPDKFKNNEELNQSKLQQYKQASHSQTQAEAVPQGHGQDRTKDYFGKERYKEDYKVEMGKLVDEEEKKIISPKLQEGPNAPKTPEYVPSPYPQPGVYSSPVRREDDYDPELGFNIHMDYVANIDKGS